MEQNNLTILDTLNERKFLLSKKYNAEILDRDLIVFRILIDSEPAIFFEASRDDFVINSETALNPDVTLFFDKAETLSDVLFNFTNPNQLFLEGQYRSDGNIVLSQIFLHLFQKA
ncbi:hypothetical protein OA067_01855 [Gammaproteobacteria bacterium]|nr:hypothetical protein [Gammaproteobacteria bacterium]